jgi:hypothetical protein
MQRTETGVSLRAHAGWLDIAVLASVFAGILLYLLMGVPEYLDIAQGGDYPHYVAMAETPITNSVPSPWRYRLLNPLLASALMAVGIAPELAFLALTSVFAFASCVLMLVFLQHLGLTLFAARAGALLFAVSVGGFIPLRRYYGYTDGLTNLFVVLILIATIRRKFVVAAALLALGTIAKESVLLLLPFVASRVHAAHIPLMRTAAILCVPLIVFASLRLLVPPDGTGAAAIALTWEEQVGHWRNAMIHGVSRWVLWSFAYSMGPVWIIAASATPANWPFVRQSALYLLPIAAPLLRTTDTDRALMLAFPIVFPLATSAMGMCQQRRGRNLMVPASVACTLASQLTFAWSAQTTIGPVNEKDAVFLALSLLPAAILLFCKSRRAARLSWNGDDEGAS